MVLKSMLTPRATDSRRQEVTLEDLALRWRSQQHRRTGIRPALIASMTIKMLMWMSMLRQLTRYRLVDQEPNSESSEVRKSMSMRTLNWKRLTFGARKSQLIQSKTNLDRRQHSRDLLKVKSNIFNGILSDHPTVGWNTQTTSDTAHPNTKAEPIMQITSPQLINKAPTLLANWIQKKGI